MSNNAKSDMEDPWFRKQTNKQMIVPRCLSSKYGVFQEYRGGVPNLDCDGGGRQGNSPGEIDIFIGLKRQVDVGQVKGCSNILSLQFRILNIDGNVVKSRSIGKNSEKNLCKENVEPRIFGRGEYLMSWVEREGDEGDTSEL